MSINVAPVRRPVSVAARPRRVNIAAARGRIVVRIPSAAEIPIGTELDASGRPILDAQGNYIIVQKG